jgi:polysaccharide pyruvyl transferase WcaK-like protein
VSRFRLPGRGTRDAHRRPRVGLFGYLGSGNIGNDASLEAMLKYLRADQPGAILDAMCTGPETVEHRYGVPAIPLWLPRDEGQTSAMAVARKSLAKMIDTIRIASWVRHHEVVIVPGMGVLETTLRTRPWQGPYTMLVLCVSGRIFRTKVALVSVGANVGSERLTRWLFAAAGRFAFYRSYRDELSPDAMEQQSVDTSKDRVYTDLAFGLPVPSSGPGAERPSASA